MNNKTLGIIALSGAPFLLIGTYVEELYKPLQDTWFTGLWGILYITPWMGSIVALQRVNATGSTLLGRRILQVLLFSLAVANFSNLLRLLIPYSLLPSYFLYIDLFWPLSNVIMLVAGITAFRAKVLQGWMRFVPLFTGCWLPFAFLGLVVLGRTQVALCIGSLYSVVAWSLLAVVVMKLKNKESDLFERTGYRFA